MTPMAEAPTGKVTFGGAGPGAADPPTLRTDVRPPASGAHGRSRPVIGLVSATAAGSAAAQRLASARPGRTRVYEGPVRDALRRAFGECEQVVCFLATCVEALEVESVWPLPAAEQGAYVIRVTDRAVEAGEREVVLRPPSLVVGVGASRNVPAEEILDLVHGTLRTAGLSPDSLAELATVDAKADEPGIVAAAAHLGVPLVTHSAEELAAVDVPNPSDAPLAAVGTPSVAEAAALVGGGELLVPKRKSERADGQPAMATCAVVRRPGRGRLAVVGLGPGARDLLTPCARAELGHASVLVGLDRYVDRLRDLLRLGTLILESGPGAEEERTPRGYRRQEEPR